MAVAKEILRLGDEKEHLEFSYDADAKAVVIQSSFVNGIRTTMSIPAFDWELIKNFISKKRNEHDK